MIAHARAALVALLVPCLGPTSALGAEPAAVTADPAAWLASRWAGTDLAALAAGARQWRAEKGSWPADCAQAASSLQPAPRLDPWGSPYACTEQGGRFVVRSTGPDGRAGTPDDLSLDAESKEARAEAPPAPATAAAAPAAPAPPEAEATALTLRRLADGLESFRKKEGHYPVADKIEHLERWLVAEHLAPAAWTTVDGWGRPLRYRTTDVGSSYTLASAGADGRWESLAPGDAAPADESADIAMADGKLVRRPPGLAVSGTAAPAAVASTDGTRAAAPEPKDPLERTRHRMGAFGALLAKGRGFPQSDDAERLARELGSPSLATDGWGRTLHYLSADGGRRCALVSAGADGRLARDMEAYARGAAAAGDDVVALDAKLAGD